MSMTPSQDVEEASDGSIRIEYDEPTHRPCFSRKKKIMMAVFNVAVVSVILGVFVSRSKTTVRSANQLSAESPYGEIHEGSNDHEENSEELGNPASIPKEELADFDAITIYDGPLPVSFSSRSAQLYRLVCEDNQVLTTLDLVTDGYAWETSWEINRADGTQLAFGPPTGSKYQRMTSYKGELCLPVGRNVLVMYDNAGDGKFVALFILSEKLTRPSLFLWCLFIGLCCVYGNGKMTISLAGETLVETGDEDFKKKEYPFELFNSGSINVDSFTTTSSEPAFIAETSSTGMPSTSASEIAETTTAVVTTMGSTSSSTTDISTSMAETTDMITSTDFVTTSSSMATTSSMTTTPVVTSTDFESTTTDVATTTEKNNETGDYCVTVAVLTDGHSKSETGYAFTSKPKNKSQDPVVYISYAVGDLENNNLYTDTVCVPAGNYELYVEDSFRGLCCSGGKGYYSVKIDGVEILYGGSYNNFPSESISHDIIVGDGIEVSNRAEEWLNAHNTRRESFHETEGTEYKPLVWSNTLEKDAETWLKEIFVNCKTVREPSLVEGENLSFRKVGIPRDTEEPENILKRWVDLKMDKGYPQNESLTQAMWRATRYLGCADGSKKMSDGQICYASICRYSRAGNCQMGKYDDWKEPTLADRTQCGPVCPDDGCH